MKNIVSELMDGELDRQNVMHILEAIKKDRELQEEWKTYHLIGDTLRQSSRLSMNISSSINQKLKAEPTILSPAVSSHRNESNSSSNDRKQKYKVFAFSIAASVIAMISGGVIMNHLYEPRQMMVAEQSIQDHSFSATPIMVSTPSTVHRYAHPPVEINDYLFVHREFSPGITMRGHVTNINSVPEYHERHGR